MTCPTIRSPGGRNLRVGHPRKPVERSHRPERQVSGREHSAGYSQGAGGIGATIGTSCAVVTSANPPMPAPPSSRPGRRGGTSLAAGQAAALRCRRLQRVTDHAAGPLDGLMACLLGVGLTPEFGIGQRALLVRTEFDNVLWDCVSIWMKQPASRLPGWAGAQRFASLTLTSTGQWSTWPMHSTRESCCREPTPIGRNASRHVSSSSQMKPSRCLARHYAVSVATSTEHQSCIGQPAQPERRAAHRRQHPRSGRPPVGNFHVQLS